VTDAVVFGTLLMSLLRHADRVAVACLAQLVNVIAPIRTEPTGQAWRQTIYHPFALTAQHARGEVLRVQQNSPRYPTEYGDADIADVVATFDAENGDLTIFAVNRDQEQHILLDVDLRAFPDMVVVESKSLGGSGLGDTNTAEHPDRVVPRRGSDGSITERRLKAPLPPVSWTMLRLARADAAA
jgi:alpha-N-arabinofuranosidase